MAPGDPRGCLLFSRRMSARPRKSLLIRHQGELCPGVGVTNLARPAERIVAFYNHRGTCEQWIKQGEGAIGHRFAGPALYARVKCFAVDVKSETIAITDPGIRANSAK
jgi:hypothetical protein